MTAMMITNDQDDDDEREEEEGRAGEEHGEAEGVAQSWSLWVKLSCVTPHEAATCSSSSSSSSSS